jgi:hypothetical protein
MITDKAKELLAAQLLTLINGGTHKIGLGGNSTSPLATDLDVAVTGITVTPAVEQAAGNNLQIKLEVLGSDITGLVIREAGIFDSVPNLLQRVNFEGVGPFSSTERLQIFINIEVD